MTRDDISMLNYILGRFEGIAFGVDENVQDGILDTCEKLLVLLTKFEHEVENNGVQTHDSLS